MRTFLLIAIVVAALPAAAETLYLSDIHFDPFADPAIVCRLASARVENWTPIFESSKNTKWPGYDADTTYPLFVSALTAARARGAKTGQFDRVVVTGDYLRHNFEQAFQQATAACKSDYRSFVINTMRYVGRRIEDAFPKLNVINAIGNNDSTCGDYDLAPDSDLFAALRKEWRVNDASFRIGGYYSIGIENTMQEYVVLNDIFWSAKYKDTCGSAPASDPGAGQMAWLAWTLYRLQSEKKTAVLIMHIPPGIDAYLSSKAKCPSPAVPLWNPAYADQFMALLQKYPGVVTEMVAGHTHMEDIRTAAGIKVRVIPSVTPDFGNNPGFIFGTTAVYLTNLGDSKPNWQAGIPLPRSPVTDQNRKFYSCARTEMGAQGYNRCACGGQ